MSAKKDPSEQSVLHGIYRVLCMQSARKQAPIGQNLKSGARLTVSVKDRTTTVIISRPDKPLGGVEIETFKLHCAIPAGAARAPAEGQQVIEEDNVTWHRVAWRFKSE
jgi:hypothetical protein